MSKLRAMTFDLVFNKPISETLASPGGYEVAFGDNVVQFDFFTSIQWLDDDDPYVVHCEVRDLDDTAFANTDLLQYELMSQYLVVFNEFYIDLEGFEDETLDANVKEGTIEMYFEGIETRMNILKEE